MDISELMEQKKQALESQLKYWQQSKARLQDQINTVTEDKLPAAVAAYDTVSRRELETIEELLKIERVKSAPARPRSTSVRTYG